MAKTQRTEALHQAARRYVLAKQAEQAIEQHHFDKLIERGLVVKEAKQLLIEGDKYQAYRRLLMIEDLAEGASRKALPPKGAG